MADGKILRVDEAKAYLTIEHNDDDVLVGDLIEEAEATLQGYLEVPIESVETTEYHDGGTSVLFLRRFPIDEDGITVTDTQGTSEDATDDEEAEASKYRVYPEKGQLVRTSTTGIRSRWPVGHRRWKVEYTGGLDQHPDWSRRVKAELRASLRDLVAHWYLNREAAVSRINEGAGMSKSFAATDREIPGRVRAVWDRYTVPI